MRRNPAVPVISPCSESWPGLHKAYEALPDTVMIQCCQAAVCWEAGRASKPQVVLASPQVITDLLPLRCRWDGYLSVLPSSLPGLPLLWPASDQALLEGTALLDKLRGSLTVRGSFVEPPSQVRPGTRLPTWAACAKLSCYGHALLVIRCVTTRFTGALPCVEALITAGIAWVHRRASRPGPSTSTPLQPCPFAGRHLSMPKSSLCMHEACKLHQPAWQ